MSNLKITQWPPIDLTVESFHAIPLQGAGSPGHSVLICRVLSGGVRVGDTLYLNNRLDSPLVVAGIEPMIYEGQTEHRAGILFKEINLSYVSEGQKLYGRDIGPQV